MYSATSMVPTASCHMIIANIREKGNQSGGARSWNRVLKREEGLIE